MADVTVLELAELTNPNTVGVKFYVVVEGDADENRWISYDNLIQYMALKSNTRSEGAKVVTVGSNTITFKMAGVNTPFPNTNYSLNIYDKQGLGIAVTSQSVNGFVIEALTGGSFDYIATLNS